MKNINVNMSTSGEDRTPNEEHPEEEHPEEEHPEEEHAEEEHQPEPPVHEEEEENVVVKSSTYVNCEINFGQVPAGKTVVKTFPLKNNHRRPINYIVSRSTDTSPIYHVFDIDKYECTVPPGDKFMIKITYSPNIPGARDLDYFKIIDSKFQLYKLCFKGECIGPSVQCSVKYLKFFHTPYEKETTRIIELKNKSSVPAIYKFDDNENWSIFQVDKLRGVIPENDYVYVTIKFVPPTVKTVGVYSRQLWCLILHHEPVVLNLLGAYSKDHTNFRKKEFRYYPYPVEESAGFRGYFSDCVKYKRTIPPVSLTENYLDFGRILPEYTCQTMTTSFTNHLDDDIVVDWENEALFSIYPQKLTIPANKAALYECRFSPEYQCNLACCMLIGNVHWTDKSATGGDFLNVPVPITMRLIGHSFPEYKAWIPTISVVPMTIVLPLTLPGYPSWTTFVIKSEGHLPVLFKFLPPRKTNFVIKPMVGLVRDYEIIAVQLQVVSPTPGSYVEQWKMELNGREERLMPIYIKGQTDNPTILVGVDNEVHFETTQPGSQSQVYTAVRNVSNCYLRFHFKLNLNCIDKIEIKPPKGDLAPGEEVSISWIFKSEKHERGSKIFEVLCETQIIFSNLVVIGPCTDQLIKVFTNTVYSELCALPNHYDAGEIQFASKITTKFHLVNFGESPIFYALSTDFDHDELVTLKPPSGRCNPREKICTEIEFRAEILGQTSIKIGYFNRDAENSESLIEDTTEEQTVVFRINYICTFPILQVEDIVEHNYGYSVL